jgi:amidase
MLAWCALLAQRAAAAEGFEPLGATIAQLHAALDAGQISSEQLTRYYLDRIQRFDRQGPHINALITINAKAVQQAKQLDLAAKSTKPRGMLYGIPFIAKDNYDTADLPTSGGSAALKQSVPRFDAFVVQRLRQQGAILLGKANMSELAASYGRLGYSSAAGLTLNPYNTARNASGSSSGSAAAVAAGFAPFAIGTDSSGSIRAPASVTGLAGLRPTLGLISRTGIIPSCLTFDTPGVLARTPQDIAIVLDAIVAADPDDAATLEQPQKRGSYLQQLSGPPLQGVRLGVITNFRRANQEVDAVEQTALHALEGHGAILVPLTLPEQFETLWASVLAPACEAEFRPQFERYLQTLRPPQPRTLAQLISRSSSRAIANSATPVNPARLEALRQADTTRLTDSAVYIHILTQLIPQVRAHLQALAATHELQGFIFSTMSCPASPRFDRPDPSYVCHSDDPYKASYVASAAGFPEVTVPVGRVSDGVPVGESLMGLPYSELQLLDLANALRALVPELPAPVL